MRPRPPSSLGPAAAAAGCHGEELRQSEPMEMGAGELRQMADGSKIYIYRYIYIYIYISISIYIYMYIYIYIYATYVHKVMLPPQ